MPLALILAAAFDPTVIFVVVALAACAGAVIHSVAPAKCPLWLPVFLISVDVALMLMFGHAA